jgi:hypothetical protein
MYRPVCQLKGSNVVLAVLLGSLLFGFGSATAKAQGRCVEGYVHGQHGYFGGPPTCFGYYSTCWRPWPAECYPCPTFAEILANPEVIAPAVPLPSEEMPTPAPAPVINRSQLNLPEPPGQTPGNSDGARIDFKSTKPKKTAIKPVQYGKSVKR